MHLWCLRRVWPLSINSLLKPSNNIITPWSDKQMVMVSYKDLCQLKPYPKLIITARMETRVIWEVNSINLLTQRWAQRTSQENSKTIVRQCHHLIKVNSLVKTRRSNNPNEWVTIITFNQLSTWANERINGKVGAIIWTLWMERGRNVGSRLDMQLLVVQRMKA